MEHKTLPFFGVQWHPEKNIWELSENSDGSPYENIPHTPEAMEVTIYLAKVIVVRRACESPPFSARSPCLTHFSSEQFFVEQAKKSTHKFRSEAAEAAALIWQYPIFVTGPSFVQEYIADF